MRHRRVDPDPARDQCFGQYIMGVQVNPVWKTECGEAVSGLLLKRSDIEEIRPRMKSISCGRRI